ncbi:MAG: hypothetical protein LC722_04870 [Actinobacteria bacterium]|nr:hypothetical protein [Actinomycetota bacterium]
MTTTTATLLDQAMPEYQFRSRHQRHVAASPERVADAVERFRITGPAAVLFRLRGISLPSGSIRDVISKVGFRVLAEEPGREVVSGINGQFWAIRETDHLESPEDLESFRAFDRSGWAQGAISIRVEPLPDGTTDLSTETRVRCVDDGARRKFSMYWGLIRIFSGWLRWDLLRTIARDAERPRTAPTAG